MITEKYPKKLFENTDFNLIILLSDTDALYDVHHDTFSVITRQ